MPTEIEFENAARLWREYAKRWQAPGSACSVEVLFHAGALKTAHALAVVQAIERDRQDLARKIAQGQTVTVSADGKTMTICQGAS